MRACCCKGAFAEPSLTAPAALVAGAGPSLTAVPGQPSPATWPRSDWSSRRRNPSRPTSGSRPRCPTRPGSPTSPNGTADATWVRGDRPGSTETSLTRSRVDAGYRQVLTASASQDPRGLVRRRWPCPVVELSERLVRCRASSASIRSPRSLAASSGSRQRLEDEWEPHVELTGPRTTTTSS